MSPTTLLTITREQMDLPSVRGRLGWTGLLDLRRVFLATLGEPALSDTAAAIHGGRPLSDGLWTDGW